MSEGIGTVSVIGLGYIGLPTAAVLASRGVNVIGVDTSRKTVDTINRGGVHIVEPELDTIVQRVVKSGLLRASTSPEPADAYIIAVPTPFKADHKPDLSYVAAANISIAPHLRKGNLVIFESTSPVGTTEAMAERLAQARTDLTFPQQAGDNADVHVAYCPERVLPGNVLKELVENDRVIGGMGARSAQLAAALYRIFVTGQCLITTARTAEMCKLTENAFRDLNIAFANELSLICDRLQIDVWQLIKLANHHPRVRILQPGPGVGGHCIAVDPWFIVDSAPAEARLIKAAREVNDAKPGWVIGKVRSAIDSVLRRTPGAVVKIACFGLSFKANIDDLRESPSLEIVELLGKMDVAELLVVEPFIRSLPAALQSHARISLEGADSATRQADVILGLVDHDAFRKIPRSAFEGKIVIDTRGMWQ